MFRLYFYICLWEMTVGLPTNTGLIPSVDRTAQPLDIISYENYNITESCQFEINETDLLNAKELFENQMMDTELVNIYFSTTHLDVYKLLYDVVSDDLKINGLMEWIWLKEDDVYQGLKFPIDIDTLTFSLSKINSKNLVIGFSLSADCNKTNKINYKNETQKIATTLLSNLIINSSDSLLCHRSFDNTNNGIYTAWYVTGVWVGFDFDCFRVQDGAFNFEHITKYNNTIVLTYFLCILAYMHPFLFLIFERNQLEENKCLNKYYKDKKTHEKPYSINRGIQKIFFGRKSNEQGSEQNYKPVKNFHYVLTFISFALSLYELLYLDAYPLNENSHFQFPEVYRYNPPEYRFFLSNMPLHALFGSMALVYNIIIYKMYNEEDDFIICLPNPTVVCNRRRCTCNSTFLIPVNSILHPGKSNPVSYQPLNVGEKLLTRFTILISLKFWKHLIKHSMNMSNCECLEQTDRSLIEKILSFFIGIFIFIFDAIFNIVCCTLPVFWFAVYFFVFTCKCFKEMECCKNFKCKECCKNFKCKQLGSGFLLLVTFLFYVYFLRSQISLFLFILRIIAYLLLIAFTLSERLLKTYLAVLVSIAYILKFIVQFLNSYSLILKKIFDLSEKSKLRFQIMQKTSEGRDQGFQVIETEEEHSEIDEELFDYVVTNCFFVKKRKFLLILKCFLTGIFMFVAISIILDRNKLEYLSMDNSIYLFFVIITPQIVELFSNKDPQVDIDTHEDEIKQLIENYHKNKNTQFSFVDQNGQSRDDITGARQHSPNLNINNETEINHQQNSQLNRNDENQPLLSQPRH